MINRARRVTARPGRVVRLESRLERAEFSAAATPGLAL
jgi:hypothetical protein